MTRAIPVARASHDRKRVLLRSGIITSPRRGTPRVSDERTTTPGSFGASTRLYSKQGSRTTAMIDLLAPGLLRPALSSRETESSSLCQFVI